MLGLGLTWQSGSRGGANPSVTCTPHRCPSGSRATCRPPPHLRRPWVCRRCLGHKVSAWPPPLPSISARDMCVRTYRAAFCRRGGTSGREFFDDIHVFDPQSFSWTGCMPRPLRSLREAARATRLPVLGINLVLFGGICKSGFAPNTYYSNCLFQR